MSKVRHVPKLRFPEFQEAGDWEARTLDSLLDYQQPTAYLVSDTKYSNTYKTPVLTAGKTFILGYTDEQHGIFRENLPVIIFDDFTTATQFVDFPFKAKSSAMKILQARNGANIKFAYEAIQMISYEVGAHERHWISTFAPMSILAPKLSEQQKIADCLASLDELITLEAQKLDTLKTHKKGLMQQLFPAEGETLPKLRFPEFQDAGEWESKSLDKYFDKIRNGFVGTATPYYVADGIPYLQGKNIKQGKIDPTGLVHISRDFHKSQNKSQLDAADVLMVQSGHVGECALVSEQFSGSNCHALIVLSPCGKVDSRFFVHYFYSPQGQARIFVITTGNTIKHILASDLRVLEITAPTFEEQQQIADCLASLDDLIAAQTQKLAALKTQKKGLMQQLFPALDAEVWP